MRTNKSSAKDRIPGFKRNKYITRKKIIRLAIKNKQRDT